MTENIRPREELICAFSSSGNVSILAELIRDDATRQITDPKPEHHQENKASALALLTVADRLEGLNEVDGVSKINIGIADAHTFEKAIPYLQNLIATIEPKTTESDSNLGHDTLQQLLNKIYALKTPLHPEQYVPTMQRLSADEIRDLLTKNIENLERFATTGECSLLAKILENEARIRYTRQVNIVKDKNYYQIAAVYSFAIQLSKVEDIDMWEPNFDEDTPTEQIIEILEQTQSGLKTQSIKAKESAGEVMLNKLLNKFQKVS